MECHGEQFMCPYQQEEDRHIAEGAHVGNDDLDVGAVDQETRLGSASNEMIVRRLEKEADLNRGRQCQARNGRTGEEEDSGSLDKFSNIDGTLEHENSLKQPGVRPTDS